MLTLLLAFIVTCLVSTARADDEQYLLGDPGIKLDPKGWTPLLWADDSFRAETAGHDVMLYVWLTKVQATPSADELPLFEAGWVEHAGEVGLGDVKPAGTSLADRSGAPVARGELTFTLQGANGRAYAASFAVSGMDVHFLTVASNANSKKAQRALDDVLAKLETRKPPEPVADGGTITNNGATVHLAPGWRVPLESEKDVVEKQADKLPLKSIAECATALHPRGPGTPDVLVVCQAGLLLGVVDSYTFADAEQLLRPQIWGTAPIQAATRLELADRDAFLYQTAVTGRALAVAVVPYDQGVSRLYFLGGATTEGADVGASVALAETAKQTALASTFSGSPYVGPDEWVAYWITYRPLSPPVLGSSCCCLCGGLAFGMFVGALFLLGRRRKPAEDSY
jgi:hypothetical protein